jgi:hypothetical protein
MKMATSFFIRRLPALAKVVTALRMYSTWLLASMTTVSVLAILVGQLTEERQI